MSARTHTHIYENTHIKRLTHVDTQTQLAHTQVTFNMTLISFPSQRNTTFTIHEKMTYRTIINEQAQSSFI